MNQLPKVKSRHIVEQEFDKELLIYDLQTDTAYSLNETSKIIYQACNGQTTVDQLKRRHKFTDDFIFFALDELNKNNLLEDYSADHFAGMTRREIVCKVGLGSMLMLPVIASIIAPTAASAASGSSGLLANGTACTANNQCASGSCSPSKDTCCTRLPNGNGDLSPCTTTTDCCLSTTTSRCQNGVCCRNAGILCEANGVYNDGICCSGTCSRTTGNCT